MKKTSSFLIAMVFLLFCSHTSTLYASQKPDVPVIFVPGGSASLPIKGQVLNFVFNRGVSPTTLQLSSSYYTLVRALEKAGYKEGKTFFGAVYDWRMTIAPADDNKDGVLENVTAQLITSGDYTYAVNYLGYWLDQAVQANPTIEYVDIVTHSEGGVVARSYIQSPAYDAPYTDKNGIVRRLPKVRFLILGAPPNEGTTHSWRPWNGDFQDVLSGFIPISEIEGRLAAFAFVEVINGKQITGPDYTITRDSILQVDKNGNLIPDATQFFRLYSPLRQSLMPIYDFLLPPGGSQYTNVNSDPSLRSDVLLDLNALSTNGHNPWLLRIGTATGEGGAYATYATGAREKKSIWDFIIPGLINKNPFINTLVTVDQLSDEQGSYLPLIHLLQPKPTLVPVADSPFPRIGDTENDEPLNGDGNVAFVSLLSTYSGDPKITLVQWGNGKPPANIPADVMWNRRTDYPVYHVVFYLNPDVVAFVISTLTGKKVGPQPIFKGPCDRVHKRLGHLFKKDLKLLKELEPSSVF
jgi:hypothetical protein